MNITADLVAFFTLKNRRLNDDRLKMEDEEEEESEEDPDSLQASTTPKTYSLFEPSVNYLLGGYLSLISMVRIKKFMTMLMQIFYSRRFGDCKHLGDSCDEPSQAQIQIDSHFYRGSFRLRHPLFLGHPSHAHRHFFRGEST